MSVTAHLTEQFVLKKHFNKLNIRWLILGSYIPDGWGIDRLFMLFNTAMHRDIGFGWLHSLSLPVLISLPIYFLFGRWAFISFLLSVELHVLTDTLDSLGVMLFWPFDTTKYSLDIWPWYDQGTLVDLRIYFTYPSSLAFESIFLIWAVYLIIKEGNGSFVKGLKNFWTLDRWKS
jgi:membrane-bound metal-dependent hydrolase YbcI (DUF457 family)